MSSSRTVTHRLSAPLLVIVLALAALTTAGTASAAGAAPASAPASAAVSAAAAAGPSKHVQRLAKQRLTKPRVIAQRAKRCARLQRAGHPRRAQSCRQAVQRVKAHNARVKAARAAVAAAKRPVVVAPPVVAPPVVVTPGTSGDLVRMANANIKFGLSATSFASDLARVVGTAPDFVTLNEAGPRSAAQLSPTGYAHYKPSPARINGNAVLWRTDRWSAVSQGYRVIVDDGPMKYDKNRGASFVTLQGTNGEGRVSVIATHHMQNPAKFGPDKPLRQQLYATGMARLRALVSELSAQGPVFVAGDFNSGFRTFDTWSPRAQFAPIGVRAAMESMPVVPTHDGGGIIDYVFYQSSRATVLNQTVTNLLSDHHLMVNDFQLIR